MRYIVNTIKAAIVGLDCEMVPREVFRPEAEKKRPVVVFDKPLLDDLTAQAKASPRLRMNYDLRNSPLDCSQRMLNAIEPGTVVTIHRHRALSETMVCVRGRAEVSFYDEAGAVTDVYELLPGCSFLNIPESQWHSVKSLESGTVIMCVIDGQYVPPGEDEVMAQVQ